MILGREISTAKEWPSVRSKESRERPASLSAHRLYGRLVTAIHIGTLVAIDFDRNVVVVNEFRDPRIFVGLAIHHMAPMAPHRTYIKQHRLVLALRFVECIGAPLVPVHRLMHRGAQIRRRGTL